MDTQPATSSCLEIEQDATGKLSVRASLAISEVKSLPPILIDGFPYPANSPVQAEELRIGEIRVANENAKFALVSPEVELKSSEVSSGVGGVEVCDVPVAPVKVTADFAVNGKKASQTSLEFIPFC